MKIRFEDLPPVPNLVRCSFRQYEFSDNGANWRIFRSLVRDGAEIIGQIKIDGDYLAEFDIARVGNTEYKKASIWLLPKVEAFLLTYLLTGKHTGIPAGYPANDIDPEFRVEPDYLLRHIKREIARDSIACIEEQQGEIHGIRIIAKYPYGSIDYGFIPYSWDELLSKLEGVEPYPYNIDECDIPELQTHDLPIILKEIEQGKHLDSVFDEIPTNTIIDKTICGIGATWLAINSDCNSIIIEPNIPVIIGKKQEHPHLIAVYGEKITANEIATQISQCKDKVRLMTTPDSYPKVRKALEQLKVEYTQKYRLLFDECEKIVADIDYRQNINLPIDDFFKFKDKAMVSATPIVIDDPRFKQQGFQIIKIVPKFDYALQLELKPTNNVEAMVKKTLGEVDPDTPVCLFYNSIKGIKDLIYYLRISDTTNIYCSTEAMKPLKREGYHVFDSVTDTNGKVSLNKYNFFTSRFYSAVDIKVECKPTVIMISQVYKTLPEETPYSLIDPETEAIQIVGRFRNGVGRVIHITNTNPEMGFYPREILGKFLQDQHTAYLKLKAMRKEVDTVGEYYFIGQAINKTDYIQLGFVTNKDEINYFRYNNAYLDERLKMLYRYPAALHKAYNKSGAFKVVSKSEYALYTDEDRKFLMNKNNPKSERITLLFKVFGRSVNSSNYLGQMFIDEMRNEFALYNEAFNVIGFRKVKELGFIDSEIATEVKRVKRIKEQTAPGIVEEVYKAFSPNTEYPNATIKKLLEPIYMANKVDFDKRGICNCIALYFDATETRTEKARGWKLGNKRF